MNTSDANWIQFLGFALAAITPICGAILWHVNSEKKKYGAQRDFNHLRRNIEQLTTSISYQTGELEKQFEKLERDILDIKMYLNMKSLSDRSKGHD
ncbi:hypothetical protein [Calothrix rhizosoleniae]|uniref:hypothetical protein n=1 Tax=Calothrix rhizosoleniae TaxID=888997 RepID=UPI000B49A649|nr:hypothetical protein [Calothrix rhizosoleniae]